ncbi:hypothetical protein COT64_02930 [Candidatus Shapirobacteria bacterium CG09_land_8_20_14_0_10_39_12]|uniref:Uncharacterized protein n=1 Tax=Candidatus Shapirobacteria bacterium CG09_land_8_20_14_0_10_39_12 TaxID=1974885 RepID=A0A2H0WP12_9BACT|nr:MAG: hypothetical protein COT64_02930 [Candidatus Shapirobacteria bacterium CG09_land_8_20_14_0_10_39_12]
MPNLTFSFWSLIPAVVFSFFSFWRRLKEDYQEEAIFGLSLLLLTGLSVVAVLTSLFIKINGVVFPIVYFGAALILKVWALKTKSNLWEIFDALTLPLFYLLFFAGIGSFLSSNNFWDLKYLGAALVSCLVYLLSKNKYRSFSWYKSGKTGFLFWEASFVIFLLLSVLAFIDTNVLYFEGIIFILLTIASVEVIYYRAERNLKNDLKKLFRKK